MLRNRSSHILCFEQQDLQGVQKHGVNRAYIFHYDGTELFHYEGTAAV